MKHKRTNVGLAIAVAIGAMAAAGCSGCQETASGPPSPVKGQLPPVARKPAEGAPAPAGTPLEGCGVLAFADVDEGRAPLQAQLTAEGDCSHGEAVFTWDFGDGSPPATGDIVTHTFEKPGTFTAKVTITSSERPDFKDADDVEIVARPGD